MTNDINERSGKKLWFRRKTYGWGWTPCSWQGWLAVFVYVALIFLFVMLLGLNPTAGDMVWRFILPVTIVTLAFLELGYKKGEQPKWQWGKPKDSSNQ